MSQQSCKHLALAIAQETVCVHRVLVTIETQLYHVSGVLNLIPSLKCDLGGCAPKIKRSHCGSAGAEPASHKTILQINNEAEVNGEFPVQFPNFGRFFPPFFAWKQQWMLNSELWSQTIQVSFLFHLTRSIKKQQNNIFVCLNLSQTTQWTVPLRSSLRDS